MRKATLAALVGATALVVSAGFASADTELFGTEADFGGSQYAPGGSQPLPSPYRIVQNPNPVPNGQIKQTNWIGIGDYVATTSGANGGTVGPVDTFGDPITYPATSLGGLNITTNGLANFDNYNPATGTSKSPDANLGTSYAGLTSPTGSMVLTNYPGGYDTVTTGEMITDYPGTSTESTASQNFINALTTGTCMSFDITAPGGGTTMNTTYFETTFETFDNNGGFNPGGAMQVNMQDSSIAAKNTNEYGTGSGLTIGNDDPGSFAVPHGSGASAYWSVYMPYAFAANYASTLTFLQYVFEINGGGDLTGNVTISNVHTVSPQWAASGSGLSWDTAGVVNYNESAPNGTPANGVLTTSPNWVGGPGGYGVPNGSGVSATFGELETGNASIGLDTTQTLGTLIFNTVQWQYSLTPSSTGSSTAGSLVMDNTINGANAPAAINDIAGGQASTNYTEYVTVGVQLNSNTNVTVTRSTDILDITGNISGTGGLSMSGAGTLQLYGNNTYSGGTTVTGGTLLVSTTGALPAGKPVSVTGATLELNNFATNGGLPPPNLTITGLTMSGSHLQLDSTDSTSTVVSPTDTLYYSSTVTLTGKVSISSTSLTIAGGTLALATGVTAGSQSANTPVTAPTSNINFTSLAISGNGTLDIGNNHIIVDYSSPATDPIASIQALIKSGFNAGGTPWAGNGIISSAAAANSGSYGIGYADAADPGNPAGLSSGQIEVMYTLLGDANLDGKVNGGDFTILASNFNQGGKSWDQGDFNYDGNVNGADFTLLASNFNQSATQSSVGAADLAALDDFAAANGISLTSVPEPASMGLLTLGMASIMAQRRRRKS